jgi:hypothetical protein
LTAAQRKILEREREVAEREREIQALREIPKPKKTKPSLMEAFLNGDDDGE